MKIHELRLHHAHSRRSSWYCVYSQFFSCPTLKWQFCFSLHLEKRNNVVCFFLRPATTFLIVVFSDFVEHTVAAVARLRNTTAHTRDMETMIIGQLSRVEASRECGDEWVVIQMADVIVASVVYEMLDSPNTQLALLVAVKCKTTAKRHDKWSKFFKLCHSSLSWFYTVELTAHLRLSRSSMIDVHSQLQRGSRELYQVQQQRRHCKMHWVLCARETLVSEHTAWRRESKERTRISSPFSFTREQRARCWVDDGVESKSRQQWNSLSTAIVLLWFHFFFQRRERCYHIWRPKV